MYRPNTDPQQAALYSLARMITHCRPHLFERLAGFGMNMAMATEVVADVIDELVICLHGTNPDFQEEFGQVCAAQDELQSKIEDAERKAGWDASP